MEDFFGTIYSLFDALFGQNLAEYLWGYNCETQSYSNANLFNHVGLVTLGISLGTVVIYYYVINHPRFNRWWSWSIMLGLTTVIGFVVGFCKTLTDYQNGYIGDCLMYTRDEEGNIVSTLISESDCWGFGGSNLFVAAIFFFIFSLIAKLFSRNCKYSPF
jgi:hypothetical protein